jgi:uncharacterized membrane protein
MKVWRDFVRNCAYVGIGGVFVSAFLWSLLPLYFTPVWFVTLLVIGLGAAVGLVGLAVVGITRLNRYFAKPS